jgi:hypothetical protein
MTEVMDTSVLPVHFKRIAISRPKRKGRSVIARGVRVWRGGVDEKEKRVFHGCGEEWECCDYL